MKDHEQPAKLSVPLRNAAAKIRVMGARQLPRDLSDAELLRVGTVAKYMCSHDSGLQEKERKQFALQLRAARKEWARRFPSLPLSATFELEDGANDVAASDRPHPGQLLLVPSREA